MPLREVKDVIDEQFAPREEQIKKLFPETWTHASNVNFLAISYQLKVMGFDYRNEKQHADLYAAIEKKKLVLRDGVLIKRNPHQIYKTVAIVTSNS